MTDQFNICTVCKKLSTQSCSLCNTAYYCSREHQKSDWKQHKNQCIPFKIEASDKFGRFLQATRAIKPGETIIRKKPLVLGPKTISFPLCLGCHKRLNPSQEVHPCSKCNWPLCHSDCESSPNHLEECKIFTEKKYRPAIRNDNSKQGNYAVVLPVRALIIKKTNPGKYKAIKEMQSHLSECLDSPMYQLILRSVAPVIRTVLGMDTTDEEVLTLCSIFDTNCFDIRDQNGLVNIRGLYTMASLITHDCTHNVKHSFHGSDHEIHVIATVAIATGVKITNTYTQTLWNTLARRAHLKQYKHFECACARCADPTELGTYVGSIKCSSCGAMMVSTEPLNSTASWHCEQHCGRELSAKHMQLGNEALRKEIEGIDRRNPEDFERFLKRYRGTLHPANSHVLEVKYALSQMYGNMEGYLLNELSDELIARKINLCKDLLEIAESLESGESKFRGSLLFDLQAATVELAKRNYAKGHLTKDEVTVVLNDSISILQESITILKSEPGMKEILQERLKNLFKQLSN